MAANTDLLETLDDDREFVCPRHLRFIPCRQCMYVPGTSRQLTEESTWTYSVDPVDVCRTYAYQQGEATARAYADEFGLNYEKTIHDEWLLAMARETDNKGASATLPLEESAGEWVTAEESPAANGFTIFAFSDVEGRLDLLEAALDFIDLEKNPGRRLAALGDYIDRGKQSAQVLYTLKELAARYDERVYIVLGNHEIDFLDWIEANDDDDFDWLAADVGMVTMRSFLGDETLQRLIAEMDGDVTDPDTFASFNGAVRNNLRAEHGELIRWLRSQRLAVEVGQHILVHAGVEEDGGDNWRAVTADHTLTHKFPPSFGRTLDRTIIAGHCETEPMHTRRGDAGDHHGIYVDEGHIYLDGNVHKHNELNILELEVPAGTFKSHVVIAKQEA